MEFEEKKIIHEEMRRDENNDCSEDALMIVNEAIQYMETHQGNIGGVLMSMAPSNKTDDKRVIGAMAGSMLNCGHMLLALFQELFERMDSDMIAYFINEFMDTIPDKKKSKALQISMGVKESEFLHDLEELINKLEVDDNE